MSVARERLATISPKTYRRSAVAAWLRWVVQLATMATVFPVMIGRLGAHDFGLWAALTAPTSMMPILGLGLAPALVSLIGRGLGRARAAEDEAHLAAHLAEIRRTAVTGLVLSTVLAAITAVIGWVAAAALVDLIRVPQAEAASGAFLFRASMMCLAGMILGSALTAVLEGLGRFDLSSLAGGVVTVGNSLFLLAAVLSAPNFRTLGYASLATAAANVLVPAAVLAGRRLMWVISGERPSRASFRDLGGVAIGLGGASALGALVDPGIKWTLAALAGGVPVASYELASRVVNAMVASFAVLLNPLAPHAARILTERGLDEMHETVTFVGRRVCTLALPTIAVAASMSGPLLALWLGGDQPPYAAWSMALLSVAAIIAFPARPAWGAMIAAGRGGSLVVVHVGTLCGVACLMGLMAMGIIGAGVSAGLAVIAGNAVASAICTALYGRLVRRRAAATIARVARPGTVLALVAAPWCPIVGLLGAGATVQLLMGLLVLAMVSPVALRLAGWNASQSARRALDGFAGTLARRR